MAEQTPTESADETRVGPTGSLNAVDDSDDEVVDAQTDDYQVDDEDSGQADEAGSEDWESESDDTEATSGDEVSTEGDADEGDAELESGEREFAPIDGNLDKHVEAAVVKSLGAADSSAFFRGLLRRLRTVPTAIGNYVGYTGPAAQSPPGTRSTKGSARALEPRAATLGQLLMAVQRCVAEGATEADAFEELSELFVVDEVDEALPVLAGIVARRASAPFVARSIRQTEVQTEALMQAASRAAHALVARRGRQAIRVLPSIARVVATRGSRSGKRVTTLPRALVAAANRVAARPALVRRLLQMNRIGPVTHGPLGRVYQITGPVEITIRQL